MPESGREDADEESDEADEFFEDSDEDFGMHAGQARDHARRAGRHDDPRAHHHHHHH